jgi:phosphoglycolate phosphatase
MQMVLGDREVACQAIIFDKDGTLVDARGLLLTSGGARAKALALLAGPEAAAAWERAVGVDLAAGWLDRDGPLYLAPRREEILVAASVLYQLGHPWDSARALAQTAYDQADDMLESPYGGELLPGIAEMLAELGGRGLLVAVATSDRHWRTEASLATLGVACHFGAIVGAEDVASGKPAPDMVFAACEQLGCSPGEAIVVGDSPIDLRMARAAKVAGCVAVTTGLYGVDHFDGLADAVLPTAAALPRLFPGWPRGLVHRPTADV